MTARRRLRVDRRAFSAFYGAFAVVVAATVVFGAIAAQAPAPRPGGPDHRTAERFLETLLASTEPVTNATLGQALTRMCVDPPCTDGPTPASLLEWAGALADRLAASMGVGYLLVLSVPGKAPASHGTLEPAPGLALARAEAFIASTGKFAGLSLFLGAP